MKRILLYLFFLSGFSQFCYSQDKIYLKDNSVIEAKVTEVAPDNIRYKRWDNQSGPDYVIKSSRVTMIIYSNGTHEVFNEEKNPASDEPPVQEPKEERIKTVENRYQKAMEKLEKDELKQRMLHPHFLGYNTVSMFTNTFEVLYAYDLPKHNLGIFVPLSVGYGESNMFADSWYTNYGYYYYSDRRKQNFMGGLGLMYYPNALGRFQYFIGPCFRYAQFTSVLTSNNYPGPSSSFNVVSGRQTFTLMNGFHVRNSKHFNMLFYIGAGAVKYHIISSGSNTINTSNYRLPNIFFHTGYVLGFRF